MFHNTISKYFSVRYALMMPILYKGKELYHQSIPKRFTVKKNFHTQRMHRKLKHKTMTKSKLIRLSRHIV